jgi:hypothetical protein
LPTIAATDAHRCLSHPVAFSLTPFSAQLLPAWLAVEPEMAPATMLPLLLAKQPQDPSLSSQALPLLHLSTLAAIPIPGSLATAALEPIFCHREATRSLSRHPQDRPRQP